MGVFCSKRQWFWVYLETPHPAYGHPLPVKGRGEFGFLLLDTPAVSRFALRRVRTPALLRRAAGHA